MRREEWIKVRENVRLNDRLAFEQLYDGLWSKLYPVAYNYVRERGAAQEIVQDTLVKLWIKRERLQSVDDITAFSMRMLQHRIYDYFDKKAVQVNFLAKATPTANREMNNVYEHVEYEETFGLINSELDKLPDTTRKIFRLSRFEHFSNEQIASSLNLSVKTIEYHISQSLKHLRMRLGHFLTIFIAMAAIVWWCIEN